MMMPTHSLFAEEELGDRRSKLGDPLVGLSKHVDFSAMADEIDTAFASSIACKGRPATVSDSPDDEDSGPAATLQFS